MGWPWLREWYCLIFCASLRKCEEQRWEIWSAWRCEWICVCPSKKKWTHGPMKRNLKRTFHKPSGPCLLWLSSSLCCWSWCWGTFHPVRGFKSLIIFKRKVAAGDQLEVMQARKSEDILKMSFRGNESEMELNFLCRFKQSQITFCNFWLQASIWYSFAAWTPL